MDVEKAFFGVIGEKGLLKKHYVKFAYVIFKFLHTFLTKFKILHT